MSRCSTLFFLVSIIVVDFYVFFRKQGIVNASQWLKPEDLEYSSRTYLFNNRRYGHNQQNIAESVDKFPGVLSGWREDLQGKQRENYSVLKRDVTVNTNFGLIQGFKVYLYDKPDPKSFYRPYHSTVDRIMGECSVFLGIPYAMSPKEGGRFKPPRPHRGWQLLQAVDYGPACPQPVRFTGATKGILNMDEDCLYLNIFSPKNDAGVAQKYPVLIHIHGGKFVHGASNLFPGHMLAAFYEVIVVTINYRLGALGFLSTGDANSPGNYGILDQAMAVGWVYDNIEFFNGNRESITLFGPGAGAASAGLLMVAPQTRHIVKRVIAQSGSALADWSLIQDKEKAQNTSRVFGQLLACSVESSWKLVNCLRTRRSVYEIGNAEFLPQIGTYPWGPILDVNITFPSDDWYEGWHEKDWRFLPKPAETLIYERKFFKDLHYMTGVTTQEAAHFISQNDSLSLFHIDNSFFEKKITEFVQQNNYTLNPKAVFEAIKYMYTYWPDPDNNSMIRNQYIDMLSDYLYRAPVDKIVKLLIKQDVAVYMYVLNTTVESLNLSEWQKYPHNIEHYFLTGAPFMDVEFFPKKKQLRRDQWTENDRNMSHFFMQIFSNFARHGNPTPQQVLGMHFERASKGELRYLNINTTFNSSILFNYRQRENAFWTEYLPKVIGTSLPSHAYAYAFTQIWWEPKETLQIAFWSMSVVCLFLSVLLVICCIMWRSAKRQFERIVEEDIFLHSHTNDITIDKGSAENVEKIINQNAIRSIDYTEIDMKRSLNINPQKKKLDGYTINEITLIGRGYATNQGIHIKSDTIVGDNRDRLAYEDNLSAPNISTEYSEFQPNNEKIAVKHNYAVLTEMVKGIPQTSV